MNFIKFVLGTLLGISCFASVGLSTTSTATCFGTDTSLMLHLNGTDGSTTFTDSSTNTFSPTVDGNAQLDTAQQQFGTASLLSDGTGDSLNYTDNTAFEMGSGDFTFDWWVRFNSLAAAQVFLSKFDSTGNQREFFIRWNLANTLQFAYYTDGVTQTSKTFAWTPSTATWYHVAVIRSGSNLYAFVDGTQIGTTQSVSTDVLFDSTAKFRISGFNDTSTASFLDGWMDEIRIVKGTAVWTANFTAPSSEYTVCVSRRRLSATVCD